MGLRDAAKGADKSYTRGDKVRRRRQCHREI